MKKETSAYDKFEKDDDGYLLLWGLNHMVGKLKSENVEFAEFSANLHSIALRVIEHGANHKSDLPSSLTVRHILNDETAKRARQDIKIVSEEDISNDTE